MPSAAPAGPTCVLVTGVARFLGSSLAGRLAARDDVDRVIGIDAAAPAPAARTRLGDAEFMRIDIRHPAIGRVIEDARVTTVVHASASAAPVAAAARTMTKEMNVLGTMQLLAACQRADSVRHLVVRSTAAVYGGGARDPAVLREDTPIHAPPSSGPARDASDIEDYVRGFARRRPEVRVAMPRFAEIIGPTVASPLTRYFSLRPMVPVAAGYDPRLQFVHEADAVDLLEHLTVGEADGTVNIAGDGAMTLSQAIRRTGRLPLPVPTVAIDGVSTALRLARIKGFSTHQLRLLLADRILDTSRMREVVGFQPRYSSAEAFADFARTVSPVIAPRTVRAVEERLRGWLGLPADAGGG